MTPTWTILIASVFSRHDQLVALLDHLSPQLAPYGGAVSVILDRDDAVMPVGMKRNRLLLAADARWTSFLDDDDWVHPDFVGRVMEALVRDPDVVGWRLRYTINGVEQKPAIHSITNDGWSETDSAYLRDLSHLNPLRKRYAVMGLPFQPGFGEDRAWAERVKATGLVRSEVFIPAELYEYRYSTSRSLFTGGVRHVGEARPLPEYRHVADVRPVI